MFQRTIANSFRLSGIGIHTGAQTQITVHPAEADAGRTFRIGATRFAARAENVLDTSRCTTLGAEGVKVSTVEHLLSALCGLCIDNVLIEVEGPEIPIFDGSALPFVEAIQSAGVVTQQKAPRTITIAEPREVSEGESHLSAAPGRGFSLEVSTSFKEWPEGHAVCTTSIGEDYQDDYVRNIAPARTFAFRREVEMLLAAGLAKGGSLDNALIITPPDGFSTTLRVPQEWCAHKALDVIGDLALLDARLVGKVTAARPGHKINARFAQALL